MKYLVVINIFLLFWSKFNRIAEINELREEASLLYQNKQYRKSILLYEKLLTEYRESDETITLNLANSYFMLKKYNSAIDNYKLLINSKNPELKSNAYLQLGVIYSSNNKKELGLSYFKEALKALPENEKARYNYELLKKEQELTQKEQSEDKKRENNKGENRTGATDAEESRKTNNSQNNQQNSTPNDPMDEGGEEENMGGEEEEFQYDKSGDEETDALASKRLEELHMNERQARMILKTMRNSEIQYIQQKKRVVSLKPVSGRPDW